MWEIWAFLTFKSQYDYSRRSDNVTYSCQSIEGYDFGPILKTIPKNEKIFEFGANEQYQDGERVKKT